MAPRPPQVTARETAAPAAAPRAVANARGLRRAAVGAAAAPAGVAADPEEPLGPRERAALQRAIAHLHTQAGHPENRHLARAIRLSGGSDEAVAMALQHECPTCRRLAEPRAALPVALHAKSKEFGDMVAMDTFTFSDARGTTKIFLNVVDIATRFGIVAEVETRHPVNIWSTFLASWASWAGFPRAFLVDGGGEFEREFRQEAEALPARVYTTAPYAPQQNGVTERRG